MRKCGFFLTRRPQFSLWSGYLGDISQLVYKNYILGFRQICHIFFTKNPQFLSSNLTGFLGSKVALFFRKNLVHNFADFRFFVIVSAKENCHIFEPKKPEIEFGTRNWDIFEKIWLFPHPETAILPLERLPWGY